MHSRFNVADIRVIIALVLGIIGVFLLICALVVPPAALPDYVVAHDAQLNNAPINANAYAGVAMLVVAVVMSVWAYLSPSGGKSPELSADTADSRQA